MPPCAALIARRHFFQQCRVGLGAMALGSLLADERRKQRHAAVERRRSARRPPAALRRRRPRASSSCSWRAGRASSNCSTPSRSCRSSTARSFPQSFVANKRFAFIKRDAKLLGTQAQVRPAWRKRADDLRVPAAPGDDRRRHLHVAGDEDRRLQSRPGQVVHEHRLAAVRPAEHGGLGHLRHRQRVAAICPASSCCNRARAARAAARRTGAAAFCRRRYQGVPFREHRRRRS